MQLQEYQERQKKIADMEANLKNKDEHLAEKQAKIKKLHVSMTNMVERCALA